jgi:hypothetical protein
MNTRQMLVLLGLVIAGPVSAGDPSVEGTLGKLIEVYGGEKNLRKLDTMVQEWDMLALKSNRPADDRRSIDFGGRLKVELTYPDKHETRILNGDVGIAIYKGRPPAVASEMQRDAMRLQLMRLYTPLSLRDRVDALGVSSSEDYIVLTLREHGLLTEYFVNSETWRIEKTVGTLHVRGMGMQFVTEYSEFAMVDGVLMHHRENKFAGGTNTAVLKLRNIEFDVEFTDEDFALPDEEDATVTASARLLPAAASGSHRL